MVIVLNGEGLGEVEVPDCCNDRHEIINEIHLFDVVEILQ